jgi:hypothetical protein
VTCRELAIILWPRGEVGFDFSFGQRQILFRSEKEYSRLIEIVAKFPEKLVIAGGYAGVSNLIGAVECDF